MNQRTPTFNHVSIVQRDEFHEATMAEKSDNSSDDNTKRAPVISASEYRSLEEYRAEVFGNKLISARNK
jgi:hypothetical protein